MSEPNSEFREIVTQAFAGFAKTVEPHLGSHKMTLIIRDEADADTMIASNDDLKLVLISLFNTVVRPSE